MDETTTTRRRVVQGAGAIGVASLVGGTAVTAQEGGGGGGQGAAVRVAHASPDAPAVDVRLTATGDGGGGDGTGTPGGGGDGGPTAEIEGLEFRDVSSYAEVEPGTYRTQVVVTGDGGMLEGILEEFFGDQEGGQEGETVVFDEEIDVQEGTTYTAVAFGEISQGPASDGPDGGTPAETPEGGTDGQGTSARGFQVRVLEDDISDPGENSSRVRIFHAVPDVDAVSITTVDGGTGEGGMGDGTETPGNGSPTPGGDGQGGQTLVDELAYGEFETVEIPPGDYTLRISEAGDQQGAGGGREVELSTEGSTVYSGFALGYFDPQAAGTDGTETPGNGGGGEGTPEDGGGEEFGLVVVEDAQGGERSDGGTDGPL